MKDKKQTFSRELAPPTIRDGDLLDVDDEGVVVHEAHRDLIHHIPECLSCSNQFLQLLLLL